MPLRKAVLGVALVVVAGVLVLAEAMPQKLAATGFMGRTGQTTVIADTDLASQARDLPYWPVIVWVGHRENHPIKVTRTSFSLVDSTGREYALAGFSEVVEGYGANRLSADRARMRDQAAHYLYGDLVYAYGRRVRGVTFFPNPASSELMYDQVELPGRTWFRTLLYFPHPGANSPRHFTLRFEDAQGLQRVEVPLEFPWGGR